MTRRRNALKNQHRCHNDLIFIALYAVIFVFIGFVWGSSYEQWKSQRIAKEILFYPEKLEPYPDPISGGVQPEKLERP